LEQITDPRIFEAILSATPYVTGGAAEVGKTVAEGAGEAVGALGVQYAFRKLRDLLKRKGGNEEQVVDAVDELVAEPESEGRKMLLAEKLEAARADEDPELRSAARELLDAVKAQPGGEQHVANTMTAVGKYIAQAGPGGTANVSVNRLEGQEG
jgi:hypothetical protein